VLGWLVAVKGCWRGQGLRQYGFDARMIVDALGEQTIKMAPPGRVQQ